jgi:hypothetical protein
LYNIASLHVIGCELVNFKLTASQHEYDREENFEHGQLLSYWTRNLPPSSCFALRCVTAPCFGATTGGFEPTLKPASSDINRNRPDRLNLAALWGGIDMRSLAQERATCLMADRSGPISAPQNGITKKL